jgi:hypothetical protein
MIEPRQLDENVIREAIGRAGAEWPIIARDMAIHEGAIRARLEQTRWDAFALGLRGTPGHLMGRLLFVGGQSTEQFREAFERARELT